MLVKKGEVKFLSAAENEESHGIRLRMYGNEQLSNNGAAMALVTPAPAV